MKVKKDSNLNTLEAIIETKNQHGSAFPLTQYIKDFINCVKSKPGRILEIGPGFGAVVIECLKAGSEVVAMEMDSNHLAEIERQAKLHAPESKLTLLQGSFPQDKNKINGKFDYIFCSRVLHFMPPNLLNEAIAKIFDLLDDNGRVFTLNFTPYHNFTHKFIPVYEENIKKGIEYPGFTEDCSPYVQEQGKLPPSIHLMDETVMHKVLTKHNLVIEQSYYEPFPKEFDPKRLWSYEGKEQICVTAQKRV
ncbi:class I SAM-dependent methyltransferase [Francisella sp. LA112445]|uniref:class I SAM-dependent methyltransferase n=1 Tax=Francisella sp. LA112445 TaxID=1395624 RepID=UPI001788A82C|nr:class I SAM-dependent methyltransferase [Francisella sp. LA112445]QIW09407.1 class I SAM-dependent methyltransferase [Francisella sp. LA112445]